MNLLYGELTTGSLAAEIAPFFAVRNDVAITEIYNRGRTKLAETRIGNLAVIRTLGIVGGNALLDAVYGIADYRHLVGDFQAGRLNVADPLVRAALDSLGAALNMTAQTELLKNLAVVPDPISIDAISAALNGGV